MNPGTAANALRKQIMYSMAKELGRCNCYQCGEFIETVTEFSVEHKVPWRRADNALELFFDLSNIAFSHHTCNTKAARRKPAKIREPVRPRTKPVCGTDSCYVSGCRCDRCRKAHSVACLSREQRKRNNSGIA